MKSFDQTGRLFVFGCSMTRYRYPTWADILGDNWAFYENWADIGAGNQFIFNSVVECCARNHFNENDTVLVLWSGLSRIDAYQYNSWVHLHDQFCHDKEFACCPDGYEIMSYAWMAAVDEILTKRKCNYIPMRWTDYSLTSPAGRLYKLMLMRQLKIDYQSNTKPYKLSEREDFKKNWTGLYLRLAGPDWPSLDKLYDNNMQDVPKHIEQEITEFYQLVEADKTWRLKIHNVDSHPTPMQHLDIVKKYFPTVAIKSSTEEWVNNIENKLLRDQEFEFCCRTPGNRL